MNADMAIGIAALAVMLAAVAVTGLYWWLERPKHFSHMQFAWRFCPSCRSKLVLAEIEGKQQKKCPNCSFVHWNNPVPVAVVLIPTTDGGLVLIRRGVPPRAGMLALPAGFVDANETPEAAAIREAQEEAGIDVEIDRFIGLFMPPGVNQHLHFFLAKPTSQTPRKGSDAQEALAVQKQNVALKEIAFPVHHDVICDWLAGKFERND